MITESLICLVLSLLSRMLPGQGNIAATGSSYAVPIYAEIAAFDTQSQSVSYACGLCS